MRRTIHKKAKNKANQDGNSFFKILVLVLCAAVFLWLTWILWGSTSNSGPAGKYVYNLLRNILGTAAYLLPLFLLYWLYRAIKCKTLAFFTLLFGMSLALSGLSILIAFLKTNFAQSSLMGGLIGDFFFNRLSGVAGKSGAIIIAIACTFLGIHILFAIPWKETLIKCWGLIKEDYIAWDNAKADLRQKIANRKEEEKQEEDSKEDEEQTPEAEPIKKAPPKIMRATAEMIKTPQRIKQEEPQEEKEQDDGNEERKTTEYTLPPLDLLRAPEENNLCGPSDAEIAKATNLLETTLKNFDIHATVTGVAPGPVITRYEIKPDAGVKISSIVSISNDIALAMKARGIRVEAPIPGKDAIGFEIPNEKPIMVTVREILQDASFINSKYKTTVVLGRYADGAPATSVIEKMPHLLVAGATNSGKSICVHTMIASLLYRAKPDEIKLMLVDPKRVELTFYEGIPHLYDPKVPCEDADIIKDANGAVKSLQALVKVMEKRMKIFEIAKVKNIEGYNKWAAEHNEEKMFFIIVIIDEMADLMLQTKAAIEDSVQRLTQMGRALGIHLILCTQRPSTNVITGVIKANLPSRIALQVASKIDSRVVLDSNGADALLGKGDMLYLGISDPKPKRIQGSYISEEEISKLTDFWRAQGGPDYPIQIKPETNPNQGTEGLGSSAEEIISALTLILERRRVSQDLLKAHFGSSARATNILSVLEMKGFITKPEGSNRWEIHFDLIESALNELKQKQQQPEEEF
ncbi:MAG: DNA translocase FtsK 4TM domain-containing protein [Elusimicrobiaceae bacterium]|nr:DNA translocase FtsK 4TM domain-containing protein [Elusimicrobiaceae bacterium]